MSSSNNTTAQLVEIASDVKSIADYRILPLVLESVLFAFCTVLMVFHCVKHRNDKARVFGLFAISICLYVMCAMTWVLDIWILCLELYRLLPSRLAPNGTDAPIISTLDKLNENVVLAHSICATVIFVFCDSVSLWRAYIICGKPRWLKITCLFLFGLSGILYFINQLMNGGTSFTGTVTPLSKTSDACALNDGLNSMSLGSTVLSQALATILVAIKAIVYRKEIQSLLPTRSPGLHNSQRLVAVLHVVVETGLVYSLLWIIYFITSYGGLGRTGGYWSDFWICQISGIYPTLIVVVVSQKSSLLERSTHHASGLGSVSMCFAVSDDAESSCSSVAEKPLPEVPSSQESLPVQ